MNTNTRHIGDKVAWDHDRLIVTSDDLLERIDRPHLSVSTADSLTGCPARTAASMALPRTFDLFGPAERGNAAHLVFETLYALPGEERTRDTALDIINTLATSPPQPREEDYQAHIGGDEQVRKEWVDMLTTMYDGLTSIENPATVDVHTLEMRLDGVQVAGGVPFKGFIDRVSLDDKGRLEINDYKSGKVPNLRWGDRHGDQIRLYREALESLTGQKAATGRLLYIDHGRARNVSLAPKKVSGTLDWFVEAYELQKEVVRTREFETRPSALCGWCPLVKVCPVARKKTSPNDPRENAPAPEELGIPTLEGAPVPVSAAAAHTKSEAPTQAATPTPKENVMTINSRGARAEGKAWEATIDGQLNLNSYAAMGTVGLASMAAELLSTNGAPVNPATLESLTGVLSGVVLAAQASITGGSTDWAEGANTRVRGALRTVCEIVPLPFGGDEQHWQRWQARAVRFAVAIVTTGVNLFEDNLDADLSPLTNLASATAEAA